MNPDGDPQDGHDPDCGQGNQGHHFAQGDHGHDGAQGEHQATLAPTRPAARGAWLAVGAALLFGASTPLVQRAGVGVGPFSTAALLYAGAAVLGLVLRQPVEREARLRGGDLVRLVAMALFGAVIGPLALAWGLQRSSGSAATLMLTLEAVFTAVLARWLYRETLGRRAGIALLLITAGAVGIVLGRASSLGGIDVGLLAVLIATLAWAVDNTLSRALAERDPAQVVAAKCALGALATTLLAVIANEPPPALLKAIALVVIGASGYGLSLRFYLLAQRAFGAARTGSVFAFAPFIGALLALALGDSAGGAGTLVSGLVMLAGVWLHVAERHRHTHAHEAMTHEHAHRHDDGHHDHDHGHAEVSGAGDRSHSHAHTHQPERHSHAHVPDAHHTHAH